MSERIVNQPHRLSYQRRGRGRRVRPVTWARNDHQLTISNLVFFNGYPIRDFRDGVGRRNDGYLVRAKIAYATTASTHDDLAGLFERRDDLAAHPLSGRHVERVPIAEPARRREYDYRHQPSPTGAAYGLLRLPRYCGTFSRSFESRVRGMTDIGTSCLPKNIAMC